MIVAKKKLSALASAKSIDPLALSLGADKLAGSGLTLEDARTLGIELLPGTEIAKLHPTFKPLAGLKINYYDTKGDPLPDWPACEPFFRLRYLEAGHDFGAQAKKQTRYVQRPDTVPVAYYPANIDWEPVIQDPTQPLMITEGELKAAKACKEGFATIGLGGVHNFRSLRRGINFIPSLEGINWKRRTVRIVFDSDFRTNENVLLALVQLGQQLQQRGAFPYVISLPDLTGDPEKKTGLDDFLMASNPGQAYDDLERLAAIATPLGVAKPLFDYNERYAYVRSPGIIVDRRSLTKTTPAAFKDHLESAAEYLESVLDKNGEVTYKAVSAATAWLKWPLRQEAARLTYAPGKPQLFEDAQGCEFNTWPGWGCEPAAGDVTPFLELLDHIFTGAEPGAKEWFLRWCAYPLQHPGTKLFSSVLLYGIRHGTGKSLLGYTLGRVYGENFTELSQGDLHASFNEWAAGCQLVLGDDVAGSNKREDNDLLKKFITQKKIRVNMKFMQTYTIPDTINYFFTANHPDAFFMEDDDRRSFIHEVTVGPMPEEFYVNYDLWLATEGGPAVFDYLLHLDLGDFNPAAKAFGTAAKDRMIDDTKSDLGAWVARLRRDPETILRVGEIKAPGDMFTNRQLLAFYDPHGKTNTTANGLGRELRRSGIQQALHGKPVRWAEGQDRFYILRNFDKWVDADQKELAQHLADIGKQAVKTPKY